MASQRDGISLRQDARKLAGVSKAIQSFTLGSAQLAVAASTGNLLTAGSALTAFFKAAGDISVNDEKERIGYILVSGALLQTLEWVIASATLSRPPSADDLTSIKNGLLDRLSSGDFSIDHTLFDRPHELPLLRVFAEDASNYLDDILYEKDKLDFVHSFTRHFPRALQATWREKADVFDILFYSLNTPFRQVTELYTEQARYLKHLRDQFVKGPLIGQPASNPVCLGDVFVPLRAYWQPIPRKKENEAGEQVWEKPEKRLVADFVTKIISWIDNVKIDDTIRIISGEPGYGKSTSLKAIAATLVQSRTCFPIFLPLHRLGSPGDLSERIARELRRVDAWRLTWNPLGDELNKYCERGPIVLLFDGLDELVAVGQEGDKLAAEFAATIKDLVDSKNEGQDRIRVVAVLSGRFAAAQTATRELNLSDEKILFLLPFLIPKGEMEIYEYSPLLDKDQRMDWWSKWEKLVPRARQEVYGLIKNSRFDEITREPLLLYFLTLVDGWGEGETHVSRHKHYRNKIYDVILRSFHQRELSKKLLSFAKLFSGYDNQYEVALQALALAAWANGTSRVGNITHVKGLLFRWSPDLVDLLVTVIGEEQRPFGATLAFHLRPIGGTRTYEFLHKSFAEYLVARHFVRMMNSVVDAVGAGTRQQLSEWLLEWATYWGSRNIDEDLLAFIRDEVALNIGDDLSRCLELIDGLAEVFRAGVSEGHPVHLLGNIIHSETPSSFAQLTEWARNSEEALLVALNAAIRVRNTVGRSLEMEPVLVHGRGDARLAFTEMTRRLTRSANRHMAWVTCLDGLELSDADLSGASFVGAHFSYVVAERTNLSGTDLRDSNFEHAMLASAQLMDANLARSKFCHANLSRANLGKAALFAVNFDSANLHGTNFSGALLEGANLSNSMHLNEALGLREALQLELAKLPEDWNITWNHGDQAWDIETPSGFYRDPRDAPVSI